MTDMKDKQVEFLYIDNGTAVYIKRNGSAWEFPAGYFLFDGVEARKTNRNEFGEIDRLPSEVKVRVPEIKYVNPRWELRPNITLDLPSLLPYTEERHYHEVEERYYRMPKEYIPVVSFYEFKYDSEYWEYAVIEPVFTLLEAKHGFRFIKTTRKPLYSIEDEVSTDPALLQEKPCVLSSEESYAIIRPHVKANIDHKVAAVTSDYDFCLTVEKIIPRHEKQSYQVDVNNQDFFQKRKRKSKWETRYRVNRVAAVYKAAPRIRGKVYDGYPECPIFQGENLQDLEDGIAQYLADLMADINEPVRDCPHCKGAGVIIK